MLRLAEKFASERTRKDQKILRYLPEVQAVLLNMIAATSKRVSRMDILMADSPRLSATGESRPSLHINQQLTFSTISAESRAFSPSPLSGASRSFIAPADRRVSAHWRH
jgi:hypothetical protein